MRLFIPFFIVIFTTVSTFAEPLRFQFIVPSTHRHHRPDHAGPFTFEFRQIPFAQIEDKLEVCKSRDFLPSYSPDDPPVFHIYLPSRRYLKQYGPKLAEMAKTQFAKVCPEVELQIKFHVTNYVDIERFSEYLKHMIIRFSERMADSPEVQKYSQAMLRATEKAMAEAKAVAVATESLPVALEDHSLSAQQVRRIKYGAASVRSMIVLGTRVIQTGSAWAQGGPPMTAAMALSFGDSAIEFATVAFTRAIQKAFRSFPPMMSNDRTWIRFQQFFNSVVWNMTAFSVGRPLAMQTLAHIAEPSEVRAVTAEDVTSLIAYNLIGSFFYSAFNNGYETLRQKGWLSGAQIDLILQVNGLFDLVTNILSSNPAWHFYRFFTWGPQWLFYFTVAAFAHIAPVRINRLIAVESSITDWGRHIHDEQLTDSSWHVIDGKDFEEAMNKIKESQPLQAIGRFDCIQLLKKVSKNVIKVFTGRSSD